MINHAGNRVAPRPRRPRARPGVRALRAAATSALLIGLTACGSEIISSPTGVPAQWYTAIDQAIADEPQVRAVALLENGGPCGLRDSITVDGTELTDVADHGVVRLGGDIPAASCSWYQGTPVEVVVAQASDATEYDDLVSGSAARQQSGNVQTEQDVTVGQRSIHVVRTGYPSNPAAGTDYAAYYLDPAARGRVSLVVSFSTERSAGYDELAVATDLDRFLTG